ncbi:Glutathione S-transferase [Microbulbifer aggregans]|uniref:Glutathione S-transferase n=1 Tax=Microbulbifer aggregans TaxID=1769779 RepID=A0A1C9WAU9_9GAMM|nr:glutathione S-transferase family protein [Microbulbifer aggregans]AOS98274.1 Glutathione S-transferase [Microbulbifer aggregans]
MKLYSLPHSPYAARVRIQARMDALPLEVLPPPVPLRTEAFLERFPLGKVPVLELESGDTIAESWAIMEYLAETAPAGRSALLPATALERAQMRMLGRYADFHLAANALFPLFRAAMGIGQEDADGIAEGIAESLRAELMKGERLISDFGSDRQLTLGDIALAPTMLYLQELAPVAGVKKPLEDFPALGAWWSWINRSAAVSETLQEVRTAYHAFVDSLVAKA